MFYGWESRDVLVNGRSMHYLRTGGEGKPPLVLVHGFSDSGAAWARVAREFENDFDIVMPDMIGHGLSARYTPGVEPDMAADLFALIGLLALDRPFICGHSMGAMVTFQAAVRYPGLARAIFLEDPPWFATRAGDPPPSEKWTSAAQGGENPVARWAKTLAEKTQDELTVECRRDNPSWPEETVRVMCAAKKQLDQNIIDPLATLLERAGGTWEVGISTLAIPVGIATGNPELGGIVTAGIIERVRDLNPRVACRNFPEVGHLIHFDAHAAFVAELRAFLAVAGIKGAVNGVYGY